MKVRSFTYNGFFGNIEEGYTPYEDTFKEWNPDPGIAICACSDGRERMIPTFALEPSEGKSFPKQERTGVIFGAPCKS